MTVRIGDIEVVPLLDAIGAVGGLVRVFPGVPDEAWEPYRALYPELFDEVGWRVQCNSYLIRSSGHTLLVDTGVGEFEFYDMPERVGQLPAALADHGVHPTDIDAVFLTHVHVDHIGWNTEFGTARFLCHPAAADAARERADRPHIQRCVLPLVEAGRVEKVEDGTEVVPGVVAVELAGHDAGHTGLRIGSEAIFVADAFPHPAFLDQPDWSFVADSDAAQCRATRRTLLDEVTDTEKLLICSHYPGSGIGLVTREGGRIVWNEAA